MITNAFVPLQEITAAALRLLCREIGVVNTVRFLNQFSMGYGDYTAEREQLLQYRCSQRSRLRSQPVYQLRSVLKSGVTY